MPTDGAACGFVVRVGRHKQLRKQVEVAVEPAFRWLAAVEIMGRTCWFSDVEVSSGLLIPDYPEKGQGRRTSGESGSSAEVKVDVTAAVKSVKETQVCGITGGFHDQ